MDNVNERRLACFSLRFLSKVLRCPKMLNGDSYEPPPVPFFFPFVPQADADNDNHAQ